MSVGELLHNKAAAVTIPPSANLAAAAELLMAHQIGGLPVVDPDGHVVGMIAERDIVQALHRTGEDVRRTPVERVMRRPAPTCRADDSLQEVMARMTRERLRHLVVVNGDRILGVISVGDLVKHRLDQLETEAGVLRDYVVAQRAAR